MLSRDMNIIVTIYVHYSTSTKTNVHVHERLAAHKNIVSMDYELNTRLPLIAK